VAKEIQLRGAFRFSDEIDEAVRLLATDDTIATVITHVVPADDAETAFAAAKDSETSGKVLVDLWWEQR
jgi:L-idonate 5-dehydrogenase